ncbi:E3 binding domain-containing protein [Oceanithermus sp.]
MTEPNITPLARRLAEENGIDWRNLEGSGPDGTIVEKDILAFLAKVMAGEVELPPQPEDANPPEEIPDIAQVQEALAREGVDLEELVPGITSEATPRGRQAAEEEEVLFEMDFEEEFSFEEEPQPAANETAAVEDRPATEPPAAEFASETPEKEELFEEAGPAGWETELEPAETPEEALEELGEEFSWESAVEEPTEAAEPIIEAAEAFDESSGWELVEEPQAETASQEAAAELETEPQPEATGGVEEPAEAEGLAEESLAAFATAEAAIAAEEKAPPAEAASAEEEHAVGATVAAVFPPAFRKAVDLTALEKARADLAEAWKKNVPMALLLFRAVERALAELEVPMRAIVGKLENDAVSGRLVYPADNLRALYDQYLNAEETTEGLMVIDLGETPYAEVLLPDTPLVTLGYAGMPDNLGLLSISGDLPTDRTRFLERIAFYLERPILLA